MRCMQLQFEEETYPVWIGSDCLDDLVEHLRNIDASTFHLITDETVGRLHAGPLSARLAHVASVHNWVIDDGEAGKSLATVDRIAQAMMRAGADRRSVVIAMGGGVVGNVAGLLAALLFRGIRLVHVPTTLIAMADSVASLKQAVNLPQGKNLIGCFYTPTAVLIDVAFLETLPAVQVRSGMCEIIKNALIISGDNLTLIQNRLRPDAQYDRSTLLAIVEAGHMDKQKVMVRDKRERSDAIVFEYGHTVGHAIELASGGRITHGEAVGLGMIAAAEIAFATGGLPDSVRDLHYHLLQRNGVTLERASEVALPAVMALVQSDNKRGYVRAAPHQVPMILLQDLGKPRLENGWPLTLIDSSLVAEVLDKHLFNPARPAAHEMAVALCR